MKKIKGLLLFGILTLLGIGSSFGYIYTNYQFEFKSNNNNNILFNINPGNSNISSYLMTYQDINGDRNSAQILYRSSSSTSNLFNIGYYSLSSYSPSYSYNTSKIYSSSSCLDLSVTGSSKQLLFHLFGNNNCNSTSNGTIGNREVYINVGDSCINSGVINTSSCDYGFYKYFGFNGTFDSRSDSLIQDNQYSGSNAGKTSISFPFPDSYSFFNSISWSGTGPYELPSVYIYNQKYIYHTGDSFSAINGLYITRINDLNSTFENSDFQVIVLDLTGVFSDGDLSNNYFTYGIFDCPYSAQDILDCSFNDGGTISNLYTANSITGNVLQFLTTRDGYSAGSTYNYFSNFLRNKLSTDGTLTFYRLFSPNNANTSSTAPNRISTSVQLVSDGNNYFQDLFPGGGQSTGSMAINTGLINLCLTSPSFYELNTIFCNRVFGGRDLSYVQGLISSGAYLQSYVDGSGNLVYVVDITDEPGVLTGGVSWECYGDRCINSQSGSWGDVEPWEILHLSGGDILSSGYYLGFFESINETGYFFKCPYSYNDSRWVAGRSILNAIGRDPFLPINCFIAAYENGRRVKLFDDAFNGYSWGPLMNGDTQNHNNLFTFFDILLSVALIFFLMKFYHLFK